MSPVYSHFHETLTGLTTIRSFRHVNRFLKKNESYLNDFIRASYCNSAASQWLNFRLQMISVCMITVVGFAAVFQHIYATANASLIGLALSYILSITGLLNGLLSSFTETEKEMVSVERAHQFEAIESENWYGNEQVPRNWAESATIEYINVCLNYGEDLESNQINTTTSENINALDNVSFRIKPGQKIGICGRTGSGKSSILTAVRTF